MTSDERRRLDAANEFLSCIASRGRRFFRHGGAVACFELDRRGRVWFHDHYTKRRIYTHYNGPWRGFTGGGTLCDLTRALARFIKNGAQIHPDNIGRHWAYGDDTEPVRVTARTLGITSTETA